MLVVVLLLNLNEALELLDAVSRFDFGMSGKMPTLSIYDNQKEGFVLCVKASLVSEEFYTYISELAESRKLGIRESEGYLVIHG